MESHEIDLVQQSFPALQMMRAETAFVFYRRLSQLDPDLRPALRGSFAQLGHRLLATIAVVIGNLDRLDALEDHLADMSQRLGRHGIQPAHYPVVGAALLLTVERMLGRLYTADTGHAWSLACRKVTAMMAQAANDRHMAAYRAA